MLDHGTTLRPAAACLLACALLLAACGGAEEGAGALAGEADARDESPAPTSSPTAPPPATADLAPTGAPEDVQAAAPETVPTRFPASKYAEYDIVTLLPRDAIPAIDEPQFLAAGEADQFYDSDELVMGVTFGGEARAYSIPLLSNHEIVNDMVGGVKIAVTW